MQYLMNDSALKHRRKELRRNQTDAERALWAQVRNRRLLGMRFLRQYSVGPYILDFYCPSIRMAVELDGGQHNDPEGKKHESVRSEFLLAQGIEVLRFWNHEVLQNMQGVLAKLEARLPSPNSPQPKKVR
jgi:very-short-patch-repair endonuclease